MIFIITEQSPYQKKKKKLREEQADGVMKIILKNTPHNDERCGSEVLAYIWVAEGFISGVSGLILTNVSIV